MREPVLAVPGRPVPTTVPGFPPHMLVVRGVTVIEPRAASDLTVRGTTVIDRARWGVPYALITRGTTVIEQRPAMDLIVRGATVIDRSQ